MGHELQKKIMQLLYLLDLKMFRFLHETSKKSLFLGCLYKCMTLWNEPSGAQVYLRPDGLHLGSSIMGGILQ